MGVEVGKEVRKGWFQVGNLEIRDRWTGSKAYPSVVETAATDNE